MSKLDDRTAQILSLNFKVLNVICPLKTTLRNDADQLPLEVERRPSAMDSARFRNSQPTKSPFPRRQVGGALARQSGAGVLKI
jgi:hypothetical protein